MTEFEEGDMKRPVPVDDLDESEEDIFWESDTQFTSSSNLPENDTDSATAVVINPASCPEEIPFPDDLTMTELAEGKKPGSQYLDSCPQGQVIVGFQGFLQEFTASTVHGKMQAICGVLSLELFGNDCIVKVTPGSSLPLRGNSGDIEWTRTCPDNEVIVGFGAKTGADIDQLTFYCAPFVFLNDGDEFSISTGSAAALPKVGGIGGGTVIERIQCPDNGVARAMNLYTDTVVTAFGLGCQAPGPI
jgi:hypothetical protein